MTVINGVEARTPHEYELGELVSVPAGSEIYFGESLGYQPLPLDRLGFVIKTEPIERSYTAYQRLVVRLAEPFVCEGQLADELVCASSEVDQLFGFDHPAALLQFGVWICVPISPDRTKPWVRAKQVASTFTKAEAAALTDVLAERYVGVMFEVGPLDHLAARLGTRAEQTLITRRFVSPGAEDAVAEFHPVRGRWVAVDSDE